MLNCVFIDGCMVPLCKQSDVILDDYVVLMHMLNTNDVSIKNVQVLIIHASSSYIARCYYIGVTYYKSDLCVETKLRVLCHLYFSWCIVDVKVDHCIVWFMLCVQDTEN